jgi:hypothetical protein
VSPLEGRWEEIKLFNPQRRHRTYPSALKRACHNSYYVKRPADRGTHHDHPQQSDSSTSAPHSKLA